MHELREAVWDQVPEGSVPERFEERRTLLLEAVAALQTRPAARGGAPLRVLDAGCGAGEFSSVLLESGAEVVAVDASEGALARAAQEAPAAQRVLWADGDLLAVPSASIDLVWAGETLEHVGDGEAWLGELHRVLRPGGQILLTTPDHPLLRRLRIAVRRSAFDDHVAPWRDHLRFFTAASLAEILDRAGFEALDVRSAYGQRWARETLIATARRGS